MQNDMPIGINPIILNEKGEILLGLRKNCFGEGTWGLFGGKLNQGETFEEAAVRELLEELGIEVLEENVAAINFANTITGKTHFIQIGVFVKKYSGVPKIREPEKCAELRFFSFDGLPELFIGTKPNIELFIANRAYDIKCNIRY